MGSRRRKSSWIGPSPNAGADPVVRNEFLRTPLRSTLLDIPQWQRYCERGSDCGAAPYHRRAHQARRAYGAGRGRARGRERRADSHHGPARRTIGRRLSAADRSRRSENRGARVARERAARRARADQGAARHGARRGRYTRKNLERGDRSLPANPSAAAIAAKPRARSITPAAAEHETAARPGRACPCAHRLRESGARTHRGPRPQRDVAALATAASCPERNRSGYMGGGIAAYS